MIWTMRDGTKIALKDMTTLHIQNTVKMLERNIEVREAMGSMMNEIYKVFNQIVPEVNMETEKVHESKDSLDETFIKSKLRTEEQIKSFKAELFRRQTN